MSTSPRMQAFVSLLCARQGIDLAQAVAGDYLRLENPAGNATLLISVFDEGYIAVGYTLWHDGSMVIDVDMKFLVTRHGWEPVAVQDCFSRSWDEYVVEAGREGITLFDENGMRILSSMTEYWAERLLTWGWLRKGLVEEGEFRMLTNEPHPLPHSTEKNASKALAAHPSSSPITETLTQADMFAIT